MAKSRPRKKTLNTQTEGLSGNEVQGLVDEEVIETPTFTEIPVKEEIEEEVKEEIQSEQSKVIILNKKRSRVDITDSSVITVSTYKR
jgi:beta-glucanase (GH16 family)